MRVFRYVLLALLAAFGAASASVARAPVILLSIDGFRADYLEHGITPNLSALAAGGVRGAMSPSFPVKTYPNHYAMVTGLRPDQNGVVDNTMVDPMIPGVTFRTPDRSTVRDRRWWDQAEPIWVTAEKQGIVTAPVFWPGAEAAIRGVRPRYSPPFDQRQSPAARVDQILALLDLPPRRRPRFLTLYFDNVDTAGHRYGPDAPQTRAAIAAADAAIGRLRVGLQQRGVRPNLIIVSDHGMAATPHNQQISIDAILPADSYAALTLGAIVTLYPAAGREAEVLARLNRAHRNLRCWRKAALPAYLRYGTNPRVAPIVCLTKVGWEVVSKAKPRTDLGDHGFDPHAPEMKAIFIANGPAFRSGARLHDFPNVNVYPLLARLIGVKPVQGRRSLRAYNLWR